VCVCVCACKIVDLLIEVFNKGGDAKLDVAVTADKTAELTRMSPYVAASLISCVNILVGMSSGWTYLHIRCVTTMRSTNLHFTYLLTCLQAGCITQISIWQWHDLTKYDTKSQIRIYSVVEYSAFPFSALTLLFGRQEGHPACKKLDVDLLVVTIWLELCTTYNSFSCHHHFHHP